MKKVVTYEFESEKPVKYAKFTVSTVTVGELGEYTNLVRIYRKRVEKDLGKPLDSLTPEERRDADPLVFTLWNIWQRWAYIRPCISNVKTSDDKESWMESELSVLGFDTLDGLNLLPMDLFEALDRCARDCNPGVFAPVPDMDPQRNGSILIE